MTSPELTKTILDNIRSARNSKSILSKEMALGIGMKPSAYSKLENGMKKNWESWLPKILDVLGVDKFEIMQKAETNKRSYISAEYDAVWEKRDEENKLIYKLMYEKIKDKDDLIKRVNADIEYWKAKYARSKARLEKAEMENAVLKNQMKVEAKKNGNKKSVSFAIVGGGMINYL